MGWGGGEKEKKKPKEINLIEVEGFLAIVGN